MESELGDGEPGTPGGKQKRRLIAAALVATVVVAVLAYALASPDSHHRVTVATSDIGVDTTDTVTGSSATTTTSGQTSSTGSADTSNSTALTGGGAVDEPSTDAPTTLPLPPPAIAASPSTGLADRSWVAVTGTNLPANASVYVAECLATPLGAPEHCDYRWWNGDDGAFFTDGTGTLLHEPEARPVRRVLGDGTDCAAEAAGCELRIYAESFARNWLARTPISFRGPAGPMPAFSLRVEPSANLRDGQQVHITGNGYLAAPAPTRPALGKITLYECHNVDCTYPSPSARVADDGTLDMVFTVHRTFIAGQGPHKGDSFDCGVVTCSIGTVAIGGGPVVPISFAP